MIDGDGIKFQPGTGTIIMYKTINFVDRMLMYYSNQSVGSMYCDMGFVMCFCQERSWDPLMHLAMNEHVVWGKASV